MPLNLRSYFLDGEELALVAAVNREATDLGVSMLPLLGIVFTSDKATFNTPTDTTIFST
ncbi:Hypothetical protein FKW44_009431 [Caligus rogercresseyi]|uniref:Uncharacterized protein n=1 Tax=Caligus rogercresseyi TaxID=217165 RepID=A0A7T8HF50_CALRO|nr:Hypothetical protein FKW44_009431 [Caligus rogercresseyi]